MCVVIYFENMWIKCILSFRFLEHSLTSPYPSSPPSWIRIAIRPFRFSPPHSKHQTVYKLQPEMLSVAARKALFVAEEQEH